MSGALSVALTQVRKEFAENPRLRIGAWAIAAIVVFYLWLVLADWRAQMQKDYAAQSQQLQKIRSLAGQDEWLQRAERARALRDALQAQIPEVATLGLAQASVQTLARNLAAASGNAIRIQAEAPAPVTGSEGLWRVPVVISGGLGAEQVLQLVRRIESERNLVVIEQATILNRENRTFSLTVVAFFRVKESAREPA
ncbi:MAG: hypothetical protein NW204_06155 [Xanthomonadaceae bacterium]|nr:hypothetical protein [Xanthomonadaceae bacterium]